MWNVPIPMKLAHYLPEVVKNAPVRYHGDWNVTASPLAIVLMIIIVRVCELCRWSNWREDRVRRNTTKLDYPKKSTFRYPPSVIDDFFGHGRTICGSSLGPGWFKRYRHQAFTTTAHSERIK